MFDPNTSDLNTPFGNVNDNSFFELFPHEKHTVLHTLHNPPFVRPTAAQSLIQEPTPTKQKQKKPKAPHATASPSGGVNGGRVKKRKTRRKKLPVDPNAPPKPKRNTGLNKPLILSSSLSAIMDGATEVKYLFYNRVLLLPCLNLY